MMNLQLDELKNVSSKDRMVRKYMSELKRINEDPEFREYISAEDDNRKIENSLKKQYMREGREEGLAKGLAEGKRNSQVEIARRMLEKGMGITTILDITNLSKDELNNIMNNKEEN